MVTLSMEESGTATPWVKAYLYTYQQKHTRTYTFSNKILYTMGNISTKITWEDEDIFPQTITNSSPDSS